MTKHKIKKELTVILPILFLVISLNLFATAVGQLHDIDPNKIALSTNTNFVFTEGDSIRFVFGNITKKDMSSPFGLYADGIGVFFAKMKMVEDTFSVVNYEHIFLPAESNAFNILNFRKPFQRENGNWVIISFNFAPLQDKTGAGNFGGTPLVIELEPDGNLVYLNYQDMPAIWSQGSMFYSNATGLLLPNSDIVLINQYEGGNSNTPPEMDTLKNYALIARHYDSAGNFMHIVPIKGIDMTKPDTITHILFSATRATVLENNNISFTVIARYRKFDGVMTWTTPYTITTNVIVDADWNVISQTENAGRFIPKSQEIDSLLGLGNMVQLSTPNYNPIMNENNDYVFIQNFPRLPASLLLAKVNNVHISVYSDATFENLKHYYKFHERDFDNFNNLTVTPNGDYLFGGHKQMDPYRDQNFQGRETNAAAYILSKDFQTFKTAVPKIYSQIGENNLSINLTNNLVCEPIIRADGRFEFWGVVDNQLFCWIVGEGDFEIRDVEIISSIEEIFLPNEINSSVFPNPATDAHTTVSVDLETAGNLTVTLNNMLGQELLEIHNGFTVEGTFTKTFSLKELPIGVYYLKIVHNGNVKVEKIIRQ